jgi:hypothetical protein
MKKVNTTAIEMSASVSCTRVEIRTPKYRTTNRSAVRIASQIQTENHGPTSYAGSRLSCTYPPSSTPRPTVKMIVPP